MELFAAGNAQWPPATQHPSHNRPRHNSASDNRPRTTTQPPRRVCAWRQTARDNCRPGGAGRGTQRTHRTDTPAQQTAWPCPHQHPPTTLPASAGRGCCGPVCATHAGCSLQSRLSQNSSRPPAHAAGGTGPTARAVPSALSVLAAGGNRRRSGVCRQWCRQLCRHACRLYTDMHRRQGLPHHPPPRALWACRRRICSVRSVCAGVLCWLYAASRGWVCPHLYAFVYAFVYMYGYMYVYMSIGVVYILFTFISCLSFSPFTPPPQLIVFTPALLCLQPRTRTP